jgi:hypothetical protein
MITTFDVFTEESNGTIVFLEGGKRRRVLQGFNNMVGGHLRINLIIMELWKIVLLIEFISLVQQVSCLPKAFYL